MLSACGFFIPTIVAAAAVADWLAAAVECTLLTHKMSEAAISQWVVKSSDLLVRD